MSKQKLPFYWKASHKAWYANIGPLSPGGHPRPVRLLAGPDDKETANRAHVEYCKRVAENGLPDPTKPVVETDPLVSDLCQRFLDQGIPRFLDYVEAVRGDRARVSLTSPGGKN